MSVALTGNYAPAVLAQTPTTDLDAVVVTARKREETLLDIPQEIQTISQQQLERANLDSVKEFSRFVPSLSYNAIVPGRGTIYFRGVADDSSSFIADASAAIYLDEQPLTQSALQPEIRLVDIERIEALPGPQGTLYGSSSQSGTLRYITNKPDPGAFYDRRRRRRPYAWTRATRATRCRASLNLPLGENTAIRRRRLLRARRRVHRQCPRHEPRRRIRQRRRSSTKTSTTSSTRAAARPCAGSPNENWTVDASVVYQQMDANSYAEEDVFRSVRPARELEGRELSVVRFLDESRDDEWTQLALTLQGDLGLVQFTSATQLLHAPHRLLPGQHGLHLLSRATDLVRRELRQSTTSARTRSASAGATDPTPTASPRNSGCRARPRS